MLWLLGGNTWIRGEIQSYYQTALGWPSECRHQPCRGIPWMSAECTSKLKPLSVHTWQVDFKVNFHLVQNH